MTGVRVRRAADREPADMDAEWEPTRKTGRPKKQYAV